MNEKLKNLKVIGYACGVKSQHDTETPAIFFENYRIDLEKDVKLDSKIIEEIKKEFLLFLDDGEKEEKAKKELRENIKNSSEDTVVSLGMLRNLGLL